MDNAAAPGLDAGNWIRFIGDRTSQRLTKKTWILPSQLAAAVSIPIFLHRTLLWG
jgi:hypothetical protein